MLPSAHRLLGIFILLAGASLIITEVYFLGNVQNHDDELDVFQVIDLIFSAYYCVEVSLRIIGNGYNLLKGGYGLWIVGKELLTVMRRNS